MTLPYGQVIRAIDNGYDHYGLIGYRNTIIHYQGDKPWDAVVRHTTAEEFAEKNGVLRRCQIVWLPSPYSDEKVVERAMGAIGLGAGEYRLTTLNCENFARAIRTGKSESTQVNKWVAALVVGGLACLAARD